MLPLISIGYDVFPSFFGSNLFLIFILGRRLAEQEIHILMTKVIVNPDTK